MAKKWYKSRLARIVLIVFLVILALWIAFFYTVSIYPPTVDEGRKIDFKRSEPAPGVFKCGQNWLRKNRLGVYELYVEGDPFEMGVVNGILTKELLAYQEQVFVDRLREMIPSASYLNFLKYFVAWFNRDMDEYVPLEFQREIYGVSLSASEKFDFIAPNYQRILNYHAAHDIGHAMQNMNLVACTAFAVWDDESADSSLVVARNFDFHMGDEFNKNVIVAFVNPDFGNGFMMITWGGMTGVVSGMNDKGLTVTLNAAKSSVPYKAKTPVSLLARMILQYASNLSEAINISKAYQTFVSESFLIGSAKERSAIVIEKSPEKTGIYQPEKSRLVLTNHFQSDVFKNDQLTIENIEESASPYRYRRVEQLLDESSGVDENVAVTILRNRNGMNNKDIGLGNEKAINQLIAHHSVVFKPEELLVWVSTWPYQEGEFVCYDLKKILYKDPDVLKNIDEYDLSIPADTFLLSDQWNNYQLYKEQTNMIKNRIDAGESGFLSTGEIQHYLSLNPNYYYPHYLIGKYFYNEGKFKNATNQLQTSLQKEIPRQVDREKVYELLN